MRIYHEHLAAGMIPTSIRFLFYRLIQLGTILKETSGVLKPGATRTASADQDLIDAITDRARKAKSPGRIVWLWRGGSTRAQQPQALWGGPK
jgi:hypothetical protein